MFGQTRTSINNLKVCIFGDSQVGKTAFSVRLLTNRFICSYIRNSPTLTSSGSLNLESLKRTDPHLKCLNIQVRDVNASEDSQMTLEHLVWADCHIIILNRQSNPSLAYAKAILEMMQHLDTCKPAVIVANKADLKEEEKEVSLDECHEIALRHGCPFFELSVLESSFGSRMVLMTLLNDFMNSPTRGSSTPQKVKLVSASQRLWPKLFSVLFKSISQREKTCV